MLSSTLPELHDPQSPTPATMNRLEMTIERARNDNWQAIRRWFAEPDRPAGLNGFLQEMGMA